MASLRTAMDSAFWDCDVASSEVLDGVAKLVPGEAIPMDGARASRVPRVEQVTLLGNGFPLGLIPSASKGLGSFSLQSLLLSPSSSTWSLGLIGQFRPKKLISSIKAEFTRDDKQFPSFKDVAKHFFDKSVYALGLVTQFALTPSTTLKLMAEEHGEKEKGRRRKLMLYQKLPDHDISLEAAWPQLFIDHKGQYWDVPESVSLDLSSLVTESGLRYRLGLHKNRGQPLPLNSTYPDSPDSLMPGLCAKAAFSFEKSKDFWRHEQKPEDVVIKTGRGTFRWPSYDCRLNEPHSAISGIIGGTIAAWLGGRDNSVISVSAKSRSPVSADLFGSLCYTYQLGNFQKLYGDLTRLDARLDISSASTFASNILNCFKTSSSDTKKYDPSSHPRLNLIFQQQVAGPIVFRVDSRISATERKRPHLEDAILSLTYSFRLLESGKAVFWYSPKRKEGMVELRMFEF